MRSAVDPEDRLWLALIWAAGGLVLFHTAFLAASKECFYSVANQIGPILLSASCLAMVYSLVRVQPLALWSALPWFLAVYALYYGFGPLVYLYGLEESLAFMETFYIVGPHDLLRTNLLNSVALLSVSTGVLVWRTSFRPGLARPSDSAKNTVWSERHAKSVVLVFLAVGLPIKYVLSLPYQLGLHDFVAPGSMVFLGKLVTLSIVVLVGYYDRLSKPYRVLAYGIIVSELITALMTFSKLEVLTVALMVILGLYLRQPRMRTLVLGVTLLCALYIILAPFVLFAREAFEPRGVSTIGDFATSAQAYRSLDADDLTALLGGAQIWWTRLSYANAQTFAMQAFDVGEPGDSFALAAYAFLPRLLYPDKPIIAIGDKFTELMTGKATATFTAAGIFGEAYWNGGWMWVLGTGLFVGMSLAGIGSFAMHTITDRRLVYLPVVFIGIMMGLRPDDWFVLVYVGGLVQAAVLYGMITVFARPLIDPRWPA
jgi:hypothetical protein